MKLALSFGLGALTLAVAGCDQGSSPVAPDASQVDLTIVSGNSQSAPVSTQLPQPIRVRVTDKYGHGVPNFTVNFVVTSGGGSVFGGAEVTDQQGYADERWTLGSRLGSQTLAARSVNSSGTPVTYGSFTATATPPATVVVVGSNSTGLFMMNANGSGFKQLTTSPADSMPNLSPDHTKVTFASSGAVYVVNVNGTNRHVVSSGICGTQGGPHFSPDGNLIVYTAVFPFPQCAEWGLQMVDPLGNVADQFVQPGAVTSAASWSADGQHYFFASSELSDGENLYESFPVPTYPDRFTNIVWESAQEVTHGMVVSVSAASPDGQHVAFVGAPIANQQTTYAYIMDLDGSNLKQITTALGLGGVLSYSPDGTLIAIDHGFMNLDGSGYTVVKGCPCSFAWR